MASDDLKCGKCYEPIEKVETPWIPSGTYQEFICPNFHRVRLHVTTTTDEENTDVAK